MAATTTSAPAMATTTTTMAIDRYPKRKRAEISYAPSDDSEDDWSEEEYEIQPKKKSKQSSKPLPKHKIFPFMSLPAELRNKVYEYALSDPAGVYLTSKTKGYRRTTQRVHIQDCSPQYGNRWGRYHGYNNSDGEDNEPSEPSSFVPNLLAVSKTIHAEAGSYLYSQRMSFSDNYALMAWLTQIGEQHIRMLKSVTIRAWCGGRAHKSINFPAIAMLAPAIGLRELNIDCSIGYFSSYSWRNGKTQEIPHRIARKVFRDCYPLLEAFGKANGGMDVSVKLVSIAESNFSMNHKGQSVKEQMEMFRKELGRLLQT